MNIKHDAGLNKSALVQEYTQAQASLAADYLERARSIAPLVRRDADEAERNSMITRAVHDAFVDANLYWMTLPRELGGPELGATGIFAVIEEVACADTSTGWSLMANAGNNALAAGFMPDDGVDIMFNGKQKGITCGQFSPAGKAVEVDGGVRGGGHFQFGSGCGHADWIGGGVIIYENGEPRMLENGMPDARVIQVPRDKSKLCGNWDVIGLLGTASFDYEIPDQFVPDALVMQGAHVTTPLRGGPFHHFGWFGNGAVGHGAVVSGLMKRALQEIASIVHDKKRMSYTVPIHEHAVFRHQFAFNEASYHANRLLMLDGIANAEAAIVSGEAFSNLHYARLRQACSCLHKTAVDVVNFCHHWGASQSFRNPTALGRCTRDLAVATQHIIADEAAVVDIAEPIYNTWVDQKN